MTKRRNPYLILGLDFGASPDDASVAFARISRRLRQDSEAPYSIEDATWALHQIQQAETDHRTGVTIYRVPADPTIFERTVHEPEPEPLARTTPVDHELEQQLEAEMVADLLGAGLNRIAFMGDALAYSRTPEAKASRVSANPGGSPSDSSHRGQNGPTNHRTASPPQSGFPTGPHSRGFHARATPSSEIELAEPSKRLGAFVIDFIVILILGIAVSIPVAITELIFGAEETVLAQLALLALWVAYPVAAEGRLGQTYGKHVLGIRVQPEDTEGPIGLGSAFLRLVVKVVGVFMVGLGVLAIFGDDRRQGWHDMAAQSVVAVDPSTQRDGPIEHVRKVFGL